MRRLGWLGEVDVIGVLVFCAAGRRSHDEGLNIAGVATTAWPFLTGTVLGWLVSRGWRRPTALVPTGVIVWLCTVVVGMLLRKASSAGVAASFVVVASSVTARAAARLASRRRADPAAPLGRLTDDDTDRRATVGTSATGVGMTATFGAVARAVATNKGLIEGPFAEPLVRAAGVDYFTRLIENERSSADDGDDPVMTALIDILAAHTRFVDEFLADAGQGGHSPGGDPGLRSGHPAVSAVVAAGDNGVRDRPAGGRRLQDRSATRAGRQADREPSRGGRRPSSGLAGGAAAGRF